MHRDLREEQLPKQNAKTMRKLFYSVLMLVAWGCASHHPSPEMSLQTEWKFNTGDDPAWASPDFNDSAWKSLPVDRIWESAGFDPYDGYAWYRLRVVIPGSLRDKASLHDSLLVYLGKINNFDQTFLNGQLIGINGVNALPEQASDTSFIHAPTNYWDKPRPYTLAVNDPRIKWDEENLIAVRVFDQGGQGGMHSGGQLIRMTRLTDYLTIDNNLSPYKFEEKELQKKLAVVNHSKSYKLEGQFSIHATDKLTGKKLFDKKEPLVLQPGEKHEFEFALAQLDQSAIITYSFDVEGSNDLKSITDETPYITTPLPGEEPRINGARVTAARQGKPFLFTIPATGLRPMLFEAAGLPEGLHLDPNTGIISGTVAQSGDHVVALKASNAKGSSIAELKIVIGNRICLTPPMGWNSWNCWGLAVDEQKVIASARTYRDKGLMNHGWTYVNIDDGWEIHQDSMPKRDKQGNILTNYKFPDMKRLGDSIHALGLKFGIYSSPGPLTCGGYTASYQHEEQDARSFAAWGVDYLKYDWCSYGNIAKDTSLAEHKKPYFVMRDALAKADRDIVYSLCQYGMAKVWQWGDEVGGNLWRTTGDITDTWESLKTIGFSQVENQPYAKPGNWNDPDMLIVGWVGWGPSLHPTRLTPDEQYTHISLWSLLAAPLLIGCDLERLDEFTLNLLTNDEVIAVNQDPLGIQAKQVLVDGDIQVWVKPLEDGGQAFGVFNLGDKTADYTLDLHKAGMEQGRELRDLWRQKSLGTPGTSITLAIPSHGVMMMKMK